MGLTLASMFYIFTGQLHMHCMFHTFCSLGLVPLYFLYTIALRLITVLFCVTVVFVT